MGSTSLAAALVLAVTGYVAAAAPASPFGSPVEAPVANEIEVPVECDPARDDADAVLCHIVGGAAGEAGRSSGASRESRRLLGRIGFLTGLHLGGAISSSGSLSASHSLNVFGKVMNTALSVSYGPNGYYQGPGLGGAGGRPPLSPILADDPNPPAASPAASASSSASSVSASASTSSDKGGEASAVLSGTISRAPAGNARVELQPLQPLQAPAGEAQSARPQNRLPVADDIVDEHPVGDTALAVDALADASRRQDAEPAPVHESTDEEEAVGEEPEEALSEPPAPAGLQLSSQRRAQLEAVARVRTPSADDQRRLFLQHHNQHVAAFNRHHAKYNGDVSRVAVFSRTA